MRRSDMKSRPQPSQSIWISGVNPVKEALLSGFASIREMVIARDDQRIQELVGSAREAGVAVRRETRDALSALVGHPHHQGVALLADEFAYADLETLLKLPVDAREPLLILDCVQDPQNLGALLRSACFLGAGGVVLPKDRSAKVTSVVIKVGAGATSYLPVIQVTNLTRAIDRLKETGYWIAGLDVEGSQSIYEADLSPPLALIIGNEQKGLRPLIRKQCDLLVQIPALGAIQSLNAATAGAVALAETQRRRLKGKSK